jgi:hypothetical protein
MSSSCCGSPAPPCSAATVATRPSNASAYTSPLAATSYSFTTTAPGNAVVLPSAVTVSVPCSGAVTVAWTGSAANVTSYEEDPPVITATFDLRYYNAASPSVVLSLTSPVTVSLQGVLSDASTYVFEPVALSRNVPLAAGTYVFQVAVTVTALAASTVNVGGTLSLVLARACGA